MKVHPIPFSQSFGVAEEIAKITESKALIQKIPVTKIVKPLITEAPAPNDSSKFPIGKVIIWSALVGLVVYGIYSAGKQFTKKNEKWGC